MGKAIARFARNPGRMRPGLHFQIVQGRTQLTLSERDGGAVTRQRIERSGSSRDVK
jgi:hypothetical protein